MILAQVSAKGYSEERNLSPKRISNILSPFVTFSSVFVLSRIGNYETLPFVQTGKTA
jgi:hypothetical protein